MDTALRHRVNAGRIALKNQVAFFREQFGQVASEWKVDDTRVTFADFAISENVFAELRRSFAKDDFCSEESNPADEVMSLKSKYAWIIDPIDGTNNFALGIPVCAISLAILKHGVPIYGLIYDFGGDRLIEGGEGEDILINRRKFLPKVREFTPKEGVVGLHFPLKSAALAKLSPILSEYRVRSMGSGTLVMVYAALGLLDGAIDYKVKVWDVAGACALLKATGRELHFLEENPFPMKAFHVTSPLLPYYTGSPSFCRYIEGMDIHL